MNIQNTNKTATLDEQQFKTKLEIIEEIIQILVDNNLTITDSKDILYETSKAICKQVVRVS